MFWRRKSVFTQTSGVLTTGVNVNKILYTHNPDQCWALLVFYSISDAALLCSCSLIHVTPGREGLSLLS